MTNVEYETQALIAAIQKTDVYSDYQRLKKKISEDKDLMEQVNTYRRRCFELQLQEDGQRIQGDLEALRRDYEQLLMDDCVWAFLISERKLCQMMQKTVDAIAQAANMALDFL